jgi:hypothetical protein
VTPADMPVTRPVVAPTVALAGNVAAAPGTAAKVRRPIVLPTHTESGPRIGKGAGLTVTLAVAEHPPTV